MIVKDIIKELSSRGIFNRGKPFTVNTVYHILKNECYTGTYQFNGQVYDNIYPAIVPKEVFERVRKKMPYNKPGSTSKKASYLFHNKLICGYCGKPICAETGTAKKGELIRYYKCNGRKYDKICSKETIRKDVLEPLIMDIEYAI